METLSEQIEKVRAYALANYEQGGWDIVVESYSDNEIKEALDQHGTVKGALVAIALDIGAYDQYRHEIKSI